MINIMNPDDFPKIVHIQTSNRCNSQCIFCPNRKIKSSIEHISWDLCEKIIDQCAGRIDALVPYRINEPLIYPDLFRLINYVKEKSPKTRIYIYTNAIALTDEMARKLISAGVEWFYFSIAGANAETFRQIQGVDAYNCIIENVTNFIDLVKDNNSVYYTIGFSLVKQNAHEMRRFIDFWRSRGARSVQAVRVVNFDRDFDGCLNDVQGDYNKPCKVIFEQLHVAIDGKCCLCCDDWKPEVILGDLKKNTIEEIWNGEIYRAYRQLHLEGRKHEIPLCKNCRNPYAIEE